jgi:ABC-type nitrate/sulfonate/bicarbonate transport system ATPase subunit
MSRYSLYVRVALLFALVATFALLLGDEPWGPI